VRRARLWRTRQEQVQSWAGTEQIETWRRDVSAGLSEKWKEEETRDA